MQRYKQPHFDVHPDGEWIRYADHVEAMKRIAGAPVAQGLTELVTEAFEFIFDAYNQPGDRFETDYAWCHYVRRKVGRAYTPLQKARAILAQAAPSAQQAEPVAWVRLGEDGELRNEFIWDAAIEPVRKQCGQWLPLVIAAPAPSASPAKCDGTVDNCPNDCSAPCSPSELSAMTDVQIEAMLQMREHEPTIFIEDEILSNYDEMREEVWEAIKVYADIHARAALQQCRALLATEKKCTRCEYIGHCDCEVMESK